MSAREQADFVSQSRKAFNRSLCRLVLKKKKKKRNVGESFRAEKRNEHA